MKLLQLLALAATAAGSPVNLDEFELVPKSDGSFEAPSYRVTQVEAPPRFRHPAIDMFAVSTKYGTTPSDNLTAAAARARVSANPYGPGNVDREYLSPVTFGGQRLTVLFDTGSSDIWTFSTKQPAAQRKGHTAYKCNKALIQGARWSITYGDGSKSNGVVTRDTVTVGGVSVAGQPVECAKKVSASLRSDKNLDGIFGLGFKSGNQVRPQPINNWFLNAKGKLDQPLFTAYLRKNQPGSYDFGYIGASKHTGTVRYSPVNPNLGYWLTGGSGYSIGSGAKRNENYAYVIDTGTSISFISDNAVTAYYNQVPGSGFNNQVGGFIYPCSRQLPSFSVYLNGNKHTVPGRFLNYAAVGQGFCFGGLQPASTAGLTQFGLLGDTFLKSQLAVFDSRGPKVGFAPQS